MTNDQIERIQRALRQLGIDAWLLYTFRDTNPVAWRLLGLERDTHVSRRWAWMVPAEGSPRGLVHAIEPHIARYMSGPVASYASHEQFADGLRAMLDGVATVAMEYSPMNAIPVVSRVDAGIVELVRSLGTEVVSSGDLISLLEAVLTPEQIESARFGGNACREIMLEAFDYVATTIRHGVALDEFAVQQMILGAFERRGMETDHPPIVAVNANSANPHYAPTADVSAPITRGDFLLIDLWGRRRGEREVFGDITWTCMVDEEVPQRIADVFEVVRSARDGALEAVRSAFAEGRPITGAEVDHVARQVIVGAGYGPFFTHRTGHSISTELHGAGANIDGFETNDTRRIIEGTSFSIEPGIYLPGEFGIRSELDVLIDHDGNVEATSEPLQHKVVPLLASVIA